jgi:hypothetical protein
MRATSTTRAPPRVVDARGLLHRQTPKATRACDAADAYDGLVVLQNPTQKLLAVAYDVSVGSVARASRLTPEQRMAVRQGQRPLVLPATPSVLPIVPATPPAPPVTMDARTKLAEVVAEIGIDGTLALLAENENEKVAA